MQSGAAARNLRGRGRNDFHRRRRKPSRASDSVIGAFNNDSMKFRQNFFRLSMSKIGVTGSAHVGLIIVAFSPHALGVAGVAQMREEQPALTREGIEFFEKRIRPVLTEKCYKCHSASAEKIKGGLLLDSREGMLKGGESGKPAIVTGEAERSRLIEA